MMKTCKQIFLSLFFMIVVSGCANAVTAVPLSTSIASTSTPIILTVSASPTSPATVSPSETPTTVRAQIDPTTDPSTWPAEVQAKFKTVLTTPDKATQADWDAYDAYVVTQMQTTLKAAGVPNADNLNVADYSLIKAMAEYAKNHGYEFDLTPSMARLIITDTGNLISTVNNNGYGLSGAVSPPMNHDTLLLWAKSNFTHVTIFGQKFMNNPDKLLALNIGSTEGDAVALLNIPGVDPGSAQGILIKMKKPDGSLGFGIVMVVYPTSNPPKTRSFDLCSTPGDMAIDCAPGISLPATDIANNSYLGNRIHLTKQQLLTMFNQNNPLHINAVYFNTIWRDGLAVPDELRVSANIPPKQ